MIAASNGGTFASPMPELTVLPGSIRVAAAGTVKVATDVTIAIVVTVAAGVAVRDGVDDADTLPCGVFAGTMLITVAGVAVAAGAVVVVAVGGDLDGRARHLRRRRGGCGRGGRGIWSRPCGWTRRARDAGHRIESQPQFRRGGYEDDLAERCAHRYGKPDPAPGPLAPGQGTS